MPIVSTRSLWINFSVFVLLGAVLTTSFCAVGQEVGAPSNRKVFNRVVPQYSPLARTLRLSGIVRVEVVVESNGVVKAVEVKGGHLVVVLTSAGSAAWSRSAGRG